MTGNRGFSQKKLTALPGHEEEVTESSTDLGEGYFVQNRIFCLVSWVLVLIISI